MLITQAREDVLLECSAVIGVHRLLATGVVVGLERANGRPEFCIGRFLSRIANDWA